jgi:hypothetical protein
MKNRLMRQLTNINNDQSQYSMTKNHLNCPFCSKSLSDLNENRANLHLDNCKMMTVSILFTNIKKTPNRK